MPRTRAPTYPAPPALGWYTWLQGWEVAVAAHQVVAMRTARMMWGGWPPSARDQAEYTRMVQEKGEALVESSMAAALAWQRGGAAALQQSLRPVHRKVTANRRRLARARA